MAQQIFTRNEVKRIYNNLAEKYDASLFWFYLMGFQVKTYRQKAIERLHLKPGDTVVDLGCGTGLNFEWLKKKIGPEGKVIGVDLSNEMLEQAKKKAENSGWKKVQLVQEDMGDYQIPGDVDGVLSTLAITMSPDYDMIIRNIKNRLQPGKRMSIFELQKPRRWPDWLVKLMVQMLKSYGTRYQHTKRTPCRSMTKHFSKTEVKEYYFGSICITSGEA